MPIIRQFSSFFVIGLISVAAHYSVLVGLKTFAHWSVIPATLCGFVCGGIVSYILNRRHTFGEDRPHSETGWRFAVVTSAGFFLTWGLMHLFLSLVGEALYLRAQLVTTGIVMFWNFGANRIWTFRTQRASSEAYPS